MTTPLTQLLQRFPLKQYLSLFVSYFLILFCLKILTRGLGLVLNLPHVLMLLGGLMGMCIGIADRLVYAFVSQPTEEYSLKIKEYLSKFKIVAMLQFMYEHEDANRHLSTNNIIFLVVWCVLALLLITTSFNGFGRGLILGIGLVLARDLYVDRKSPQKLKERLFWPIAREMTDEELKFTSYAFWGAFGLLSLMAV